MTPHLVEQMLVSVCIGLLRVYQRTLSPDHGAVSALTPIRACRFEPTCSEYMIAALERFRLLHGLVLGFSRLFRCHPWSRGGYDPVPEKTKR